MFRSVALYLRPIIFQCYFQFLIYCNHTNFLSITIRLTNQNFTWCVQIIFKDSVEGSSSNTKQRAKSFPCCQWPKITFWKLPCQTLWKNAHLSSLFRAWLHTSISRWIFPQKNVCPSVSRPATAERKYQLQIITLIKWRVN